MFTDWLAASACLRLFQNGVAELDVAVVPGLTCPAPLDFPMVDAFTLAWFGHQQPHNSRLNEGLEYSGTVGDPHPAVAFIHFTAVGSLGVPCQPVPPLRS